MNQPPTRSRQPDWRRPPGVTTGTWEYVNEWTIADHYDDFVAGTPLCQLDQQIVAANFPPILDATDSLILDLGCGSGRMAVVLAERGYQIVGVDLSQRMLQVMNRKAEEKGLRGRVHAVRANLVQLEAFASNSADHAICLFSTLGMIHGRACRCQMLSQVARIVRPGGQLIVHVHNRWAALTEPGGKMRLLRSWIKSCMRAEHDFGDSVYAYRGLEKMFMHRFSQTELQTDLRTSGWKVRKIYRVSLDGTTVLRRPCVLRRPWARPGGFIVVADRSC